MGSTPNPQPGDWLIHEALAPRAGFLAPTWKKAKRAEVITVTSTRVGLYFDGEPGFQTVVPADITRWWNIFDPPASPDDIPCPGDLVEGLEFYHGTYRAVIRTVRGSWVSYVEECGDFSDVFRLMPYCEFVKVGWATSKKPSVYDWLRRPAV